MAEALARHIRYPFAVSLIGGTLAEEPDYDRYILQLIKQVLFTSKGERVCRPDFGAGLRRQVFAPNNDATAALARTIVFEALNRWLGTLIRIDGVNVRAEEETLFVTVTYYVFALGGEPRVLNDEVTF